MPKFISLVSCSLLCIWISKKIWYCASYSATSNRLYVLTSGNVALVFHKASSYEKVRGRGGIAPRILNMTRQRKRL